MTDFKPGDKVRITIDRTVNEDGGVFAFGQNIPLDEIAAWGAIIEPRPDSEPPADLVPCDVVPREATP